MTGRARKRDREAGPSLAVWLALVPIVVLFGTAIAGAVRQSLDPGFGPGERPLGLGAWRELARDPTFGDALWFSLRTTLLATAISAVLALAASLALRHRGAAPRLLVSLPLPVPHLIVAVGAVLWLGPGGLVERAVGALPVDLVGDRAGAGVVLVYVVKEAPFLTVLLLAVLGRRLREREEVAATLGAGRWQRLRWVVLPAVAGPLALGSLVVAAFALGALEVPLAVGPNAPQTLAGYALQATQLDAFGGQATAAASLLVATALSLLLGLAALRLARSARA
ncbi:MAG: ABC transporter permease subunit [Thermoleophilia bacterium]